MSNCHSAVKWTAIKSVHKINNSKHILLTVGAINVSVQYVKLHEDYDNEIQNYHLLVAQGDVTCVVP